LLDVADDKEVAATAGGGGITQRVKQSLLQGIDVLELIDKEEVITLAKLDRARL